MIPLCKRDILNIIICLVVLIGFISYSSALHAQTQLNTNTVRNAAQTQKAADAAPLGYFKPHHVAISVPNFEETIRWYQEKLGFKVVIVREFPDISTPAANLELNGFHLEIFARNKSTRPQPPAAAVSDDLLVQGVKHIALIVEDLDAVVAELRRRDVQLLDKPTSVIPLGLRLCFIRDNNGNLIELGEELAQR